MAEKTGFVNIAARQCCPRYASIAAAASMMQTRQVFQLSTKRSTAVMQA